MNGILLGAVSPMKMEKRTEKRTENAARIREFEELELEYKLLRQSDIKPSFPKRIESAHSATNSPSAERINKNVRKAETPKQMRSNSACSTPGIKSTTRRVSTPSNIGIV